MHVPPATTNPKNLKSHRDIRRQARRSPVPTPKMFLLDADKEI